MTINPQTGTVTLPNGQRVGPELTREEFRSGPLNKDARTTDCGTMLFQHCRFEAGLVEDHPLLANACFFEETLLYLDMTVSLYPPGATDWSSYSLDTEAAIKSLHDRLLTEQLGEPSGILRVPVAYSTPAQASLAHALRWDFDWGQVWSSHDPKGGGTSMCVRYGNRLEEAHKAYRLRTNSQ